MANEDIMERKLSGETMFRGKLLDVEHWQVELPDGRTALREIVVHGAAVAVVPVDADGYVTLVRQYRPAVGRAMLEIPAGLLDSPDEPELEAAQRELREETGLIAANWVKLCDITPSPGYLTERIALFLARDLSQGETELDDDEFLRVEKLPLGELVGHVMRGELTDAKTLLGAVMAARVLGV